jgi:predicted metalloprotease
MSPRAAPGGGGGALLLIGIVITGKVGGCDPSQVQQVVNVAQQAQQQRGARQVPAGDGIDNEVSQLVEVILAGTEDVWSKLFQEDLNGADYRELQLILFEGSQPTGWGPGNAAMRPFYCPGDQKIYVQPSFFNDLAKRHNAPGDFSQTFVIAYEVPHHVQNLLGLNKELRQVRQGGNETQINQHFVRLELQAHYLAGVWPSCS